MSLAVVQGSCNIAGKEEDEEEYEDEDEYEEDEGEYDEEPEYDDEDDESEYEDEQPVDEQPQPAPQAQQPTYSQPAYQEPEYDEEPEYDDEDDDDDEPEYEDDDEQEGEEEPEQPEQTYVYNYKAVYKGPTDEFMDTLTDAEKIEFVQIFLEKTKGKIKGVPEYVIGQNNKPFFPAVFIHINRARDIVSTHLLEKIYKQIGKS